LIDDLQIRHGIVCAAKLDPLLDKFAEEAKYVLYRAVRELLLNIRKHARASRVKINVSRKDSSVKIEVRDNGCGFAGHKPSAPHDSGGFGLSSVRADLTSIGADLLISSRIGRGTRAIIVIPVPL
jgi:signal transduction histidine kinase